MTNLKEEFAYFLKNYRAKNDQFEIKAPSIELEELEDVEFILRSINQPLHYYILPTFNASCSTSLNDLQVIKEISNVKITYTNDCKHKLKLMPYQFRITSTSTNNLVKFKNWAIPKTSRTVDFDTLSVYEVSRSCTLKTTNLDFYEFKMLPLLDVEAEKRSFWVDLFPISLNPIAPIHVNAGNIVLKGHMQLESLKEERFDKIDTIQYGEIIDGFIPEVLRSSFQKKCIINADSLENDLLIEHLQSRDWLIFERENSFKGLPMLQIHKRGPIALISIDAIDMALKNIKSNITSNLQIIVEIEDSRYTKLYLKNN